MSAPESTSPPKRPAFTDADRADMRAYAERVFVSADGSEAVGMARCVLFVLDEISRWESRAEALEDMILNAAPLTWAATGDEQAAQEWEKAAVALIDSFYGTVNGLPSRRKVKRDT